MSEDIQLTEREMAVARKAAELAIAEVANEFYRQVGRGFVTKILVWIGVAFVGFMAAKGWFVWPSK